jgi:DnaJ-domain-containing protein 1
VSTSKRILDLLKANINALLDKAGAPPDTAVGQMTDEELEAELTRRRERKAREENERRDRESAEKAARDRAAQRAFEQMKARAAGGAIPPDAQKTNGSAARKPPPGQQKRSAPPPRPAAPGTERRLRELYAQLEVPYGAPFEEVKKSFRRLMRKYHPDLHAGNPTKHKTATQLTMSLTVAYNELEQHLVGGPNKQK